MSYLYNTIFYQPVFNALVFLYDIIPGNDLGVAIIILTIFIRLVLYPLSVKSIRAQKGLQDLQPKLEALKKQYSNNREQLARETMQLYKEEKINPLSSCLPLLLQLPFLIALFHAFRNVTKPESLQLLYSFIPSPEHINTMGLYGLLDLSQPNYIIAILAGLAQFWQGKMLVHRRPAKRSDESKDEDFATLMNQQMLYVMPAVTTVIAWTFPAGLALYWFLSTLLLALQQWVLFRKKKDGNLAS
ncbi:MAG: YidC/Oxa1 family membrane protein insertase [Patescibacteria group bacterium]|jgi:YidC/Oxa1 family membrane protein insertase